MSEIALAQIAGRKEWIGLAVLALPSMLYSMDLTVLNLAAPQFSADLEPSSSQLLWIVDIYGFLIAGSLITMGTLGDRIGRRRLLLIGAFAFGCASLLAAFAPSARMLIAARALLGLAGATLAPSTLSLLRNMFEDPGERTRAIAVWSASFALGAAIGPLLGGILLARFWWGSVFLINAPFMAALLILGPILLPEYRAPAAGRLDVASAVLSLAAVLALVFGVKSLATRGGWLLPAAGITGGVAIGWMFLYRQRRLREPFIDLTLFRSLAFSAALVISVLTFFVNFGTFFFVAQYLQLVLGLAPLEAGLWLLPSAMAFIVGSAVAPRLVGWKGPAHVMAGGFLIAAAGLGMLTQVDGPHGLGIVTAGGVLLALGLAPNIILTADLIVAAVPAERAGLASGMSEASTELGGALGIAVLGSVMIAVYRSEIGVLPLDGLSPDMIAGARETLAGAANAVAQLPGDLGADLLSRARGAFTDGMQLAASIGAAVALSAAILAGIVLRAARVWAPSRGEPPGFDPTACCGSMRAHVAREESQAVPVELRRAARM
jgi:MFS transporter, DHA2 family, multidrug resistance protein